MAVHPVHPWLQVLPPILLTLLTLPASLAVPHETIPAILMTVLTLPGHEAATKDELSVACSDYALEREGRYICTEDGITCLAGWTDENSWCQEPVCGEQCKKPNGICHAPDECLCEIGYYGEECEYCTPLPGCMNGNCSKPFSCDCMEGWTGQLCDQPLCGKECRHGYCTHPNGECHCFHGWSGPNCDECLPLPGCDVDHGYCEDPMDCKCDPGWAGTFCNVPSCPEMCEAHGHGRCQDGVCKCSIGWLGEDCSQCVPYPGCYQGTCGNPWECNCRQGWTGLLCNITNDVEEVDDAKDTSISEKEDDVKDTAVSQKENDTKDTDISEKEDDAKDIAISEKEDDATDIAISEKEDTANSEEDDYGKDATNSVKEDASEKVNDAKDTAVSEHEDIAISESENNSKNTGTSVTSVLIMSTQPTATPNHATTHSIVAATDNEKDLAILTTTPLQEEGSGFPSTSLNDGTNESVKSEDTSTPNEEDPENIFITASTLIEKLDNFEPSEQLQLITNGQTIDRDHKNGRKINVEQRRNRNRRRHKREITSFEMNLDEIMNAASMELYDNNDIIVRNNKIHSQKIEKNGKTFPLNANTDKLMKDNHLFFSIKSSGKRKVDKPKLNNNYRREVSNSKWYPLNSDLDNVRNLNRPNLHPKVKLMKPNLNPKLKLRKPSPKIYLLNSKSQTKG